MYSKCHDEDVVRCFIVLLPEGAKAEVIRVKRVNLRVSYSKSEKFFSLTLDLVLYLENAKRKARGRNTAYSRHQGTKASTIGLIKRDHAKQGN